MSSIPLLPKCKDPYVPPLTPGVWQEKSVSLVDTLSDTIEVTGSPQDARDEISIPDVWAPVKMFEIALFDERQSLYPTAIREWRGLIALLALAGFHDLKLSIDRVEIAGEPPATPASSKPKPSFMRALRKLRPADNTALFNNQNWSEIGRILYKNQCIGLLVPSVILCPVRGYEKRLLDDTNINWKDRDGCLLDPVQVPSLRPEELAIIGRYCRYLRESLESERNSARDPHKLGYIMGLLGEFERKLQDQYIQINSNFLQGAYTNFNLPRQAFYPALRTMFLMEQQQQQFATCLETREPFRQQVRGALLVDNELENVLDIDSNRIQVWDVHTLDSVRRRPQLRDQIRRSAAAQGFMMIEFKDLFAPELCRIDKQGIIGHNDSCHNFILPFQPLLLLFLSPEEINQGTRIQEEDGDRHVVTLQFTLTDHLGQSRTCAYKKTYYHVTSVAQPTSLSVWPNFRSPSWQHFYAFCATSPRESIKPVAILGVRTIQEAINSSLSPQNRVASAQALGVSIGSFALQHEDILPIRDNPAVYCALYRLPEPPEAIACEAEIAKTASGGQPQRRFVGLILMQRLKEPRARPETWTIGIDFGSTNTTAYYTKSDKIPRAMRFENRSVPFFQEQRSSSAQQVKAGMQRLNLNELQHALEFLPLSVVNVPFLTILESRSIDDPDREWPLWSDRINYIPDAIYMVKRLISQGSEEEDASGLIRSIGTDNLLFNLKWGQATRQRQKVRLFLAQVALQALAEAVAQGINSENIQWVFSYPEEAFDPDQREYFKGICPKALRMAINPYSNDEPIPNFRPESKCTALYFSDERQAYFAGSVLTIDVGGGTTDILLCQNRRGIWRGSLKYAGRNILIDYLNANPELLQKLAGSNDEVDNVVNHLYQLDPRDKEGRSKAIEVLVNSDWYQKTFEDHFINLASDTSTGAPGLARIAAFSLAALLYYIARTINYLSASSRQGEHTYFDPSHSQFHICLGGRGSLIFGKDIVLPHERAHILEMFQNVAKLKSPPHDIEFSQHPKHEVAHGLLVEERGPRELNLDSAMTTAILGEELLVDGQTLDPLALASSEILAKDWQVRRLPELRAMITAYEAVSGRRIIFSDDDEQSLCQQINDELIEVKNRILNDAQQRRRSEREPWLEVEPLYVIALRALTELLIQEKDAIT